MPAVGVEGDDAITGISLNFMPARVGAGTVFYAQHHRSFVQTTLPKFQARARLNTPPVDLRFPLQHVQFGNSENQLPAVGRRG